MDVGVDETGHEGVGAEVDDGGVCGAGDVLADLGDAVAGDEDFAGREELAVGDVEQMRGVQDYGFRLWLCRLLSGGGEGDQEREGGKAMEFHVGGKDSAGGTPPPSPFSKSLESEACGSSLAAKY